MFLQRFGWEKGALGDLAVIFQQIVVGNWFPWCSDPFQDYLRLWHGGWHIFVGAVTYFSVQMPSFSQQEQRWLQKCIGLASGDQTILMEVMEQLYFHMFSRFFRYPCIPEGFFMNSVESLDSFLRTLRWRVKTRMRGFLMWQPKTRELDWKSSATPASGTFRKSNTGRQCRVFPVA